MIDVSQAFLDAQKRRNINPIKEVKITLPTKEEIDITNRLLNNGNIVKELEKDLNESKSDDVVLTLKNDDGYFQNTEGTGILDIHDDVIVRIKKGIQGVPDRVRVFSGQIDPESIDEEGRTHLVVTCLGWEKDCESYNAEGIGDPDGDPLKNISGLELDKTVYNGQVGVRELKYTFVDNAGNDTLEFAGGEPKKITSSFQEFYDKREIQYIRAKSPSMSLPSSNQEDEIVVVNDGGTLKAGYYWEYIKLPDLVSKAFTYIGVTNQDIKVKPIGIPSGQRIFNYLTPRELAVKVCAIELWKVEDGKVYFFVGASSVLELCTINLNNGDVSWETLGLIDIGTEKHITKIIYSSKDPERVYVFSGYTYPSGFGVYGGYKKFWGSEGLTMFDRTGPMTWNKVYEVQIGTCANKEMVLIDSILETRLFTGCGDKLYWTYLDDDASARTTLRIQRIDADTGLNISTIFTATPTATESCTPRAPGGYSGSLSYKIPWAKYSAPNHIDRKITEYWIQMSQLTTVDDPFQLFNASMFAVMRVATGGRCIDFFQYSANPTYYGRYRLCFNMNGPFEKEMPDLEFLAQDIKPNFYNGYHFDYVKDGVFTGWSDKHIYIQWGIDNSHNVGTEICENQIDAGHYPYAAPLPFQWEGNEIFVGVLNDNPISKIIPFIYMPSQMCYITKAKTKGYTVRKFLNKLAQPFVCLWKRPDKDEGIFYYRGYWRGEMSIDASKYKHRLKEKTWKFFYDGVLITDEETGKEWWDGDLGFGKRLYDYTTRFVYDSYGNVLAGWNYEFYNRKRKYWQPLTKYLIQVEPFDKINLTLIDKENNTLKVVETFVIKVVIHDRTELVELYCLEKDGETYKTHKLVWDIFIK